MQAVKFSMLFPFLIHSLDVDICYHFSLYMNWLQSFNHVMTEEERKDDNAVYVAMYLLGLLYVLFLFVKSL